MVGNLITFDPLTISLLTLALTRFLGIMVFVHLFFRKPDTKYVILFLGWTIGEMGTIWGFYSHAVIGEMENYYFSFLAGLGTFFISCGILMYFNAIKLRYIYAGSILLIGYGLIPLLGINTGPNPGLIAQSLFSAIIFYIVLLKRKTFFSKAQSSYYWLVSLALVSIILTLLFVFGIIRSSNMAYGFVGTSVVHIIAIIYFLNLEYALSINRVRESENINIALFEISNAINTTKNLDNLYKSIHKSLNNIIDCTNFFIALVDIHKKTLYFPYHVDATDDDFSAITNFDPANSLTGLVVTQRKPLLMDSEKLQERSNKSGIWGPTPKIWMGVPLINNDEVIGVIAIQSYEDPNLYDWKDLEVLSAVSDQVAIAISRKKAEEDILNHRNNLEDLVAERNKEIEAFTNSIAHDMTGPLRAIEGYTNILLEDYTSQFDEEGKHIGKVIKDNSRKMDELIRGLRFFVGIGQKSMTLMNTDMKGMVKSMYYEVTDSKERERVEITIDEIPNIVCDSMMLKQVWKHLIANAIKFSSKKDKSIISVSCKEEKDKLIYSITDNGIGFDMKHLDDMFNLFRKLHVDIKYEGHGVGLALVQRIIERHKGKVWADSEEGKGATFYFSLPKIY